MTILIADRFSEGARKDLELDHDVLRARDPHQPWIEFSEEERNRVEGIITRTRTAIDDRLLDGFPSVRAVVSATSGFDHVDISACVRRRVAVAHCPEAHATSVAELTLFLAGQNLRHLTKASAAAQRADWSREGMMGQDLCAKRWGIVGLGRVGRKVAHLTSAFGAHTLGFDPYISVDSALKRVDQVAGSLIELFSESDIVSLHVPLTAETRHLVGEEIWRRCPRRPLLLMNTCRGAVVDEVALLSALDENPDLFFSADVVENEPPAANHRLLDHPRVFLTPHIGAMTETAFESASHEAITQLKQLLTGQDCPGSLPPKAAWFKAPLSLADT